jgi:hypothetical protein
LEVVGANVKGAAVGVEVSLDGVLEGAAVGVEVSLDGVLGGAAKVEGFEVGRRLIEGRSVRLLEGVTTGLALLGGNVGRINEGVLDGEGEDRLLGAKVGRL